MLLWFISKNLRVTFEICHMRGATPQYCQFTFINENMTWSQYGLALEFSENRLDLEMSLHQPKGQIQKSKIQKSKRFLNGSLPNKFLLLLTLLILTSLLQLPLKTGIQEKFSFEKYRERQRLTKTVKLHYIPKTLTKILKTPSKRRASTK